MTTAVRTSNLILKQLKIAVHNLLKQKFAAAQILWLIHFLALRWRRSNSGRSCIDHGVWNRNESEESAVHSPMQCPLQSLSVEFPLQETPSFSNPPFHSHTNLTAEDGGARNNKKEKKQELHFVETFFKTISPPFLLGTMPYILLGDVRSSST
jgi:hypothetical protein